MWIFTKDSFVSIVAHRDKPGWFLVRGRFKGDAARFLGVPAGDEKVTPRADYRYRLEANAARVQQALAQAGAAVEYPNFKGSVRDKERHDTYLDVWGVMYRAQFSASRGDAPMDTLAKLVAERDKAQDDVRKLLLKVDECVPAHEASGMRWRIQELEAQVQALQQHAGR